MAQVTFPIYLTAQQSSPKFMTNAVLTGVITNVENNTGDVVLTRNGATWLTFPASLNSLVAVSYVIIGLQLQILEGDVLKNAGNGCGIQLIFG